MKQKIFIISSIVTTVIIGFVAYFTSSPARIVKTTLSLLDAKHLDTLKQSIVDKIENKDDVERLKISYDICVTNIKEGKYSDEQLKNILAIFESMEKSIHIDSVTINEFIKSVQSEF